MSARVYQGQAQHLAAFGLRGLSLPTSERRIRVESFSSDLFLSSASTSRGTLFRAVCVLCIALVCVMGMVQATHSHPENSTTSHHTCSICATAHVGLNTHTVAAAPVLVTTALAGSISEVSRIFRSATIQFIRPPPAF
jgi:hypothetical protein